MSLASATEPDAELLPPGTVVGEYVLESLVGAGGFARVYRAHHPVLQARVAVKVITRALSLDVEATRRFEREAQAASRIAHPGVVRVLGYGKIEDGRAYQVMELVDGPSLDDLLEDRGRLPLEQALAYLDAIAAALDAAHAAGIVHRDLKPANILLAPGSDGELQPRLTDFGIAKALEAEETPHLTRTGTTLGTPAYMSPEQALGRQVGAASDVYSFGVVAYELITGRVPFEGESALELMMHHVQSEPVPPSSVDASLGAAFDGPLAALLAKKPEARPASLAEAMTALHSGSRPAATTRRPLQRWLAAAAVIALSGIGTWAVLQLTATSPTSAAPANAAPTSAAPTPAPTPPAVVPASVTPPPAAPAATVPPPRESAARRSKPPRPRDAEPAKSPTVTVDAVDAPAPSSADTIEIPSDYTP